MPNPKTGTVTDDVAAAIEKVKAGSINYKVDKNGVIAAGVGKASFDEAKLIENVSALLDAVVKAKPASAKGNYIQNVTIASCMNPGIKLEPSLYAL